MHNPSIHLQQVEIENTLNNIIIVYSINVHPSLFSVIAL